MKKISTLLGIIIIVVVAFVLFCGVFAYQYFTKSHQTQVQPAGWKTYINDKQNYQISYPAGTTIIGDSNYNKYCITFRYGNGSYIIIDSLRDEQDALAKGLISMAGCSGIDGLGAGYVPITQSIVFNGQTYQAQGYQDHGAANSSGEYFDTALIFPLTDNITIQLGYANASGEKISAQEYNNIMATTERLLSTFKSTK